MDTKRKILLRRSYGGARMLEPPPMAEPDAARVYDHLLAAEVAESRRLRGVILDAHTVLTENRRQIARRILRDEVATWRDGDAPKKDDEP